MMKCLMLRENKGFTLIELLVVIGIIGILSAIAVPLFLGQRTKAMRAEGETNIKIIYAANENFYAEYGRYAPLPPPRTDMDFMGTLDYLNNEDSGIRRDLKAVKFGHVNDLKFEYKLESCEDGQAFLVSAKGKAGSPVAGIEFRMNQKNEMGDSTLDCGP